MTSEKAGPERALSLAMTRGLPPPPPPLMVPPTPVKAKVPVMLEAPPREMVPVPPDSVPATLRVPPREMVPEPPDSVPGTLRAPPTERVPEPPDSVPATLRAPPTERVPEPIERVPPEMVAPLVTDKEAQLAIGVRSRVPLFRVKDEQESPPESPVIVLPLMVALSAKPGEPIPQPLQALLSPQLLFPAAIQHI